MSEELKRLIADDAYAASFQTMGQYRSALLKAVDSAQDVARAPEGWKLVPVEPTPTMRKAAADAWLDCDSKLILNKARAAIKAGPDAKEGS